MPCYKLWAYTFVMYELIPLVFLILALTGFPATKHHQLYNKMSDSKPALTRIRLDDEPKEGMLTRMVNNAKKDPFLYGGK